ncbi:MAG TPA: NADH-quinone oxidoreductase subunit J [Candidatus Binataceae bacterium]|nr:NADH-quinone oxidoreductase subunit J [Candidatus Binataceae bacterium]
MPPALFIFLAVVAILSSLGVVIQRNPVHCLLALIMTLISIGALFVALDAVAVGFLQIIVYVGAIMVLFLFVIWLLNLQTEEAPAGNLALKFFATIAVAAMAAELFAIVSKSRTALGAQTVTSGYGSIDSLAQTLFGQYLMAFETTSILLLVAVIGAVAVARRALPDRPRTAPTEGRPT